LNSIAWGLYQHSNDSTVLQYALKIAETTLKSKKDEFYYVDTYFKLLVKLKKYDLTQSFVPKIRSLYKAEGLPVEELDSIQLIIDNHFSK
jgi:hypothetical protein